MRSPSAIDIIESWAPAPWGIPAGVKGRGEEDGSVVSEALLTMGYQCFRICSFIICAMQHEDSFQI